MDIQYGKVAFDDILTHSVYRKAKLSDDGVDFLYEFWHVEATVVINPQNLMAYNAALTVVPGTTAAVADVNIRHPLMIPRQTLTLKIGADTLLQTPLPGYATDAANGPFPISFNIVEVMGDKTLICKFVIEARVNECPIPRSASATPRSVILSQRWTQSMDVDQDHFGTRVTQGVVVFRSDELLKQNISPDQLRGQLGHPIPANMKRDGIHVVQESDGLTIRYVFTETEQPFNFRGVPGMTRFECYQTNWSAMEDTTEIAMGLAGQLGRDIREGGGPARIAGRILGHAGGAYMRAIPKFRTHVFVRVWGDRTSLRQNLTTWGMGVAIARIPEFFDPTACVGRELSITQDIGGKFVEISMTVTRGPNPATLLFLFNLPGNDQFLGFGNGDTTVFPNNPTAGPPVPFPKLIAQDATVAQPVPNNNNGTRGTNLSVLVAQALGAPCVPPPAPVNLLTPGIQSPP